MGSPAGALDGGFVDASLALDAIELLNGERARDYGDPRENLARIAALWSAAFGWQVTAEQVAWAFVLVKCSRVQHRATRDGYVDAVAYVLAADAVH